MLIDHDGHLNGDVSRGSHHHNNAPTLGQASTSHGNHHLNHRTIPQHNNQHTQQLNHNGSLKGGMIGSSMPTSPLLSPPNGDGRKNSSSCNVSTGSHSPRSNGGAMTVGHDGRSRQGSSSGYATDTFQF